MTELIWKVGFDQSEAKKAGKEAGKAQAKESQKGGGAFAGGFLGGLLGNLLSSVKQLFEPLSAIASLLVAALFPLLKPFLILFLKVGLLLFKWLNGILGGGGSTAGTGGVSLDAEGIARAGEGLKFALFAIGGILAGVTAALLGAPALLIGAVAILGGLIVSKVGGFFVDVLLGVVTWLDGIFNTNFIKPLTTFLQGISDIFNGLWNMIVSLSTLDFSGAWDGFIQFTLGIVGLLKAKFQLWFELFNVALFGLIKLMSGLGIFVWNALTTVLSTSFNVLKGIGQWIKDKIQGIFSSVSGFFGGSSKSVNDAIITPNGDVIRTNPNDFLIATKNPGALGGGGGGATTVNVNINGGLITDDVARDIGRILQRELNLGGRF